jgi:hypothetical protein
MKVQIFKKGDRVFCIIYGWGTISKIGKNYYPIDIEFDCNVINSYTIDGRITEGGSPTLSFTEYTLEGFSQERPEPLPKRGDVVWVRNNHDFHWEVSMFLEYDTNEPDGPYIVSPNMIEGDHECCRYLTTKNPYLNE